MNSWLEKLFTQGLENLKKCESDARSENAHHTDDVQATLALNLIAMYNLTTGYFLSQWAFASLAGGDLLTPENIVRQKRLLHRVIQTMLIS